MTFKDRLNQALTMRNMSAAELARLSGLSEGSISQYRKGEYKANQRSLEKIATALHVSIPWLMGLTDNPLPAGLMPVPAMRQIPLIGEIACGEPILAQENINDLIDIPAHIKADFALKCKGDSMINARIFDGDIVYIRKQPIVEDGEIAAVRIDNEATLKRVRLFPDHIILSAENPTYKPLVYWNSEMDAVDIIGKAVAFTSPVN